MNKKDFPIFANNPSLIYLDSASTAQKPQCVIDAECQFYQQHYANVHRGIYRLSENATTTFEGVREKVRAFINANSACEIVFTKGTTDSINLVAHSFGLPYIQAGDEIILSAMEHHSNIVPWQQLCDRIGAKLVIIPLLENGELNLDVYEKSLNTKTKLVALIHVSNVLGTVNPVKHITAVAHQKNIPVLLDGAQAVGHLPVDVQELDCDFYAFSAHKLYGPTGVGILYGKESMLKKMLPYQTGGSMIRQVTFEKTDFNTIPFVFEAGTPNIAGVIGFGAAIDYVQHISLNRIQLHESALLSYATDQMKHVNGLTIYGTSSYKSGVIAFTLDAAHAHDVATILDQSNVAVRAGHHCTMPLIDYLAVPALTRVSFGIYNELSDVDVLIRALENVRSVFHG